MGTSDLRALFALSTVERIELAQDLWDSVATDANAYSLSAGEVKEIESRLQEHRANPHAVVPWEQLRTQLGLPPQSRVARRCTAST